LREGRSIKLEGPKYAARRSSGVRYAEWREKLRRARDRQAAAPSQNEAEESDESEDDGAGEIERREWEDREVA